MSSSCNFKATLNDSCGSGSYYLKFLVFNYFNELLYALDYNQNLVNVFLDWCF